MIINGLNTRSAREIALFIELILCRRFKEDSQLFFLNTHSVPLSDRPTNAKERRGHGISRVLYTWLRRETEDQEAMAKDIESLASLGRTDRWQRAIRTWAHVARTDPDMFMQYATYTNFAAD